MLVLCSRVWMVRLGRPSVRRGVLLVSFHEEDGGGVGVEDEG